VTDLIRLLPGFLPVILFLAALVWMDGYRLVRLSSVMKSVLAGAAAAGLAWLLNLALLKSGLAPEGISRGAGPVIEEILKSLWIILLIQTRRIGFPVDAAIHGFAVGTGFALLENLYYHLALGDASVWLWVVRGFGTALLHGFASALFAVLTLTLLERHPSRGAMACVAAIVPAALIHAAFNLFLLPPMTATMLLTLLVPAAMILIFNRSERSTRSWLGIGFDTDLELLERIDSGNITGTRVGEHLDRMLHRFPGPVVADMLCLLKIHLELSLKAKGMLLAREAGVSIDPGEEAKAALAELRYLEKTVGRAAVLALRPFVGKSRRDLWQIYHVRKSRSW
jgi:RsiW-degrading membrane proteinase PrsW (M82 family)